MQIKYLCPGRLKCLIQKVVIFFNIGQYFVVVQSHRFIHTTTFRLRSSSNDHFETILLSMMKDVQIMLL